MEEILSCRLKYYWFEQPVVIIIIVLLQVYIH